MNKKWLIWSIEHRAWWAANSWGYTVDIASAGRYSFKDAVNNIRDAHTGWNPSKPPKEAIVPESALPLPK